MSQPSSGDGVLAWLWELSDGTKAAVIEHPAPPHWELRITKNARIVARQRCDSFAELMEASVAARLAADASS
jgi:hypothetical protein